MKQRTCTVGECDGGVLARGMCRKHYQRWWKSGTTDLASRRSIEKQTRPCRVAGCDRFADHYADLCRRHYARQYKHSDVLGAVGAPAIGKRLWARVEKSDGCWIWTGGVDSRGYGQISIGGKKRLVHRVSYELSVGQVPAGMVLDHVRARGCSSTRCVRADHLEPVTRVVNTLRGDSPNAINARKTECIHGHPFNEANTYVRPDGTRQCRECRNARTRRSRRR